MPCARAGLAARWRSRSCKARAGSRGPTGGSRARAQGCWRAVTANRCTAGSRTWHPPKRSPRPLRWQLEARLQLNAALQQLGRQRLQLPEAATVRTTQHVVHRPESLGNGQYQTPSRLSELWGRHGQYQTPSRLSELWGRHGQYQAPSRLSEPWGRHGQYQTPSITHTRREMKVRRRTTAADSSNHH